MYIVSYEIALENLKGYEIHINAPRKAEVRLSKAQETSERRYHFEYNGDHELICPEYFFFDSESIIVIPYFYNPGHRYPVQAYLYASSLYSSNPDKGQRAVSEETRIVFGLEKFSHSTLCRTFKDLEKSFKESLERAFGEEFKLDSDDDFHDDEISEIETVPDNNCDDPSLSPGQQQAYTGDRFPSVKDTFDRRCKMAGYLNSFDECIREYGIDIVGKRFAKNWYDKTRKLLI